MNDLADQLLDFLNKSNEEEIKKFRNRILSSHRTLQQCAFREIIWPMLKTWADDFRRDAYDARNEATCRESDRAIRTAEAFWNGRVPIPFI